MPLSALLSVANLAVEFAVPEGRFQAIQDVTFDLQRGRTLALVGESGSGKSVTSLAILGLLPRNARVAAGSLRFDGCDLLALHAADRRRLRGDRIAIIFQEPMTSLNPLLTIGDQVAEPLRLHRGMGRAAAGRRAIELLEQVGIRDAPQRMRAYPHEFSGGMRQRVLIAMAIACDPVLLIADEPTTALDVTVQAQILDLLRDLQRRTGMGLLFITHDLGVVAELADEVAVMYAGAIVEHAPTQRIFTDPAHPYTRGLLGCMPRLRGPLSPRGALPVIAGEIPTPLRRPSGCAFHPRCELGRDDAECRARSPLLARAEGRAVACWKASIALGAPAATGRRH